LITDRLLEWPPDVFALANLVLNRAEAFRFALSPAGSTPCSGPPARILPPNQPSTVWCAVRCWRCSKSAGPGSLRKREFVVSAVADHV